MQNSPQTHPPLTPSEVAKSRQHHGSNTLSARKQQGFWSKFVGNLGDPVIRILLAALLLHLLFSFHGGTDWFETAGIALAVFLATLISTLSEHGSEKAFAKLKEACVQSHCRVLRYDEVGEVITQEIPMDEVVVGDIVLLAAGETIPADGVLISSKVTVNQAAMTGESHDVEKSPLAGHMPDHADPHHPSCLLRGCTLLSGHGQMQVMAVGDSTFWGRISQEVQTDTRESPLKLRLSKLAGQISRLGYVAAALTGLIYIINMVLFENAFDTQVILSKLQDFSYVFETLFSALTLGLTVLVVAVPEGLPMMIAVVLSSNIKRMTADHVLVRKPVGIESAGSMNILFTDKTGTLTQGKLSVGQVILGDGTAFSSMERLAKKAPIISQIFTHMACTNTLSTIGLSGHSNTWQALGGNATDRALLDYVLQKSKQKPRVLGQVQDLIPFDSTSKCSCAWVTWQGRRIFYIKGAPEKLLPHLTHMYDHMGRVVPLQPSTLQAIYQELTQNGHRVLMMAQSNQILPDKNSVIAGQWGELTLVCMVTLNDKIRSQAPKSVATLHRAGIHVVMMTGDNKETATAIAKAVGILTGKATATLPYVVDSQELAHMSDTEIQNILPKLCVVARALPSDKSRLVKLAQAQNLVVGMTGDGINDAPALKCADVGFAMGDGTQVAKDAGDIIILDNNLASIAKAVLYGRTIFKSIRKFITLQLTMNLCAMGVTMICPFVGVDTPVTVVQMLWINLIMDTLGGLAFAGEAPLPSYMEEAPKRRDEPILNGYMIHQICFLGGFTIALCLAFLKLPPIMQAFRQDSQDIYLLTAFFALFIFSSVFNCFNARTDRLKITAGLTQNKAFCLVMTGVLFIQVVFIYIGGQVLRTAPLTWQELWLTAAMAALVFPADLVRKIWWRLGGHSQGF